MALAFERDPDPEMRPFLGGWTGAPRLSGWRHRPGCQRLVGGFQCRRAALEAEYGDD